jgi:hypothetical protein
MDGGFLNSILIARFLMPWRLNLQMKLELHPIDYAEKKICITLLD